MPTAIFVCVCAGARVQLLSTRCKQQQLGPGATRSALSTFSPSEMKVHRRINKPADSQRAADPLALLVSQRIITHLVCFRLNPGDQVEQILRYTSDVNDTHSCVAAVTSVKHFYF